MGIRLEKHISVFSLICCTGLPSTFGEVEANYDGVAPAGAKTVVRSTSGDNTEGEVTDSPRQRRRVLDKRNPLASEYQGLGDIGYIALADEDSEGVDARNRIKTGDLFEGERREVKGEVSYQYHDQSGSGAWQGEFSYRRIFGEKENWAVLFKGARTGAHQLFEKSDLRWRLREFCGETFFLLDRIRLGHSSITTAINKYEFALEHRRGGAHRLYLRSQFENRKGSDTYLRLLHRIGRGEIVALESTVATVRNAEAERTLWDYEERRDRVRVLVGGESKGAKSRFDYSYYFSKWKRERTGMINPLFRREGVDYSYVLNDTAFPIVSVDNGGDLSDSSSFSFAETSNRDSVSEDHDHVVEMNYERRFAIGDTSAELKLGGVFRRKERVNAERRMVLDDFDGEFTFEEMAGPDLGLVVQDTYPFGPDADTGAFRRFFEENRDGFSLNESRSRIESDPNNYRALEDVGGVYFLQGFERARLKIQGGVRLEFARTETEGNEVITDENGDYLRTNPIRQEGDYTRLLPTVEVDYALPSNLRLRVAWFKTLARPDYFDLVPFRRIYTTSQFISEGNPALVPTGLSNVVLALDVDGGSTGQLTTSLYYRGIDSFFYDSEVTISGGELDGWDVRRKENGESGSVWGIEFRWKKELKNLPLGLGGLTATGFYTFSESKAEVKSRPMEELLVPERSRHFASLSFRHTRGRWKSEVAIKYQSEFLDDIGSSADYDEYIDDYFRVDLSIDYELREGMSFFAKFYNLGDTPKREYEGNSLRRTEEEYGSWRVRAGFRFSL